MSMETLQYVVGENHVATVYLNRPPYNPLNRQLFKELGFIMDEIEQDPNVKAVIITGNGGAFAAGADIHDMMKLNGSEILDMCQLSRTALDKVESLSKPVIAAVNGLALGGGCELTLACDFRICSNNTKFGLPEINLGIIPGGGGTQRLQRLIGQAKAKELLYFGETIDAEQALAAGLVSKIVELDQLLPEAEQWAQKLADKSTVAMRMMKKSVNSGSSADLHTALDLETACFGNAFASEDRQEGMNSFIEKRKPQFVGR
ncbi:enoyl-CoA hydratase/isomerase family protein [Desertibacillus haloalkaliphilus]|uniref:enoyl-CoA hydratase/isomerase family protein n=1 Tax=Desertibacillus haloalkaliphilus TaxID=1328930 RepID=UPI001C26A3D8|nr:enoyl-CoA hydratase-related protein [Desertibacillus haloalkaliphilus]MBU8908297.1 enoyl-CoA hydratase/isomerase family protein [Desertibacillus haloalkaliphilus]